MKEGEKVEGNEREGGLLWGDKAGDQEEGWGDPGRCSFHTLTRKPWVAPCLALLTPFMVIPPLVPLEETIPLSSECISLLLGVLPRVFCTPVHEPTSLLLYGMGFV